jgi:long-chain acyl-CoA synthetase
LPASVEARLRSVPGIDQAMVVGAGRKCLVALCTSAAGRLDASARSRLEAALLEQVARLAEHERPSAIALIERPFSIEDGELTPNLKLRRAAIEERYAGLIQKLYELTDRSADSTAHGLVVI